MGLTAKWAHGGVEYPLTSSTTNSLLRDADPALYFAIELFESVLDTYIKPRLLAQAALEDLNFPSAVEKSIHFEPTPFLLSDQLIFPLLCLYRSEEQWTGLTVAHDKDTSVWSWAYVLPPMTPRQIEQLHPILRSVAVTIATFAQQSFDPAFETGQTLRELSGIQQMTAGPVQYGDFEAIEGANKWWRAVTGKLLVQERSEIVPGAFEVFAGVDAAIDLTAIDGTQIPAFIEVATAQAPAITDINPKAGTKAGGQVVEIDGTGFSPGAQAPRVLIGGAYASNVVVVHTTRLRCVTPEHDAYPTFAANVQIVGHDGAESNVLESAYTFTTP